MLHIILLGMRQNDNNFRLLASITNTSSYLQLGFRNLELHCFDGCTHDLLCPNSQHILLCQMARAKQQEDPMMREQLPGTPE